MRTAEEIIDGVRGLPPGGAIELPMLTGVHLCALGGMREPLIEERLWSWWTGRSDADRAELARMGMAQLAERGLVDSGSPRPRPIAEVGVILAARARPSFVAVCTPPATSTPKGPLSELRCLGIADQAYGLRAVLLEQKVWSPQAGPMDLGFRYFLVQVLGAARQLAIWACQAPDRGALSPRRPARVIEVYRPGGGASPDRLEVSHGKRQITVTGPDGQAAPCPGEDALSERIAELLSRSAG